MLSKSFDVKNHQKIENYTSRSPFLFPPKHLFCLVEQKNLLKVSKTNLITGMTTMSAYFTACFALQAFGLSSPIL